MFTHFTVSLILFAILFLVGLHLSAYYLATEAATPNKGKAWMLWTGLSLAQLGGLVLMNDGLLHLI